MTKIKICGLYRPCDIRYVNEARPDWCGFVIDCPKSRRNVSGEQAAALKRLGADAALVGEALMRAPDKGAMLASLRRAAE